MNKTGKIKLATNSSHVCGKILALNKSGKFNFDAEEIKNRYGLKVNLSESDAKTELQLMRKAINRNINKTPNELWKAQLFGLISKFKSRYEIAKGFKEILTNKNEREISRPRILSYSASLKFFLTYSAFEGFCKLFGLGDKIEDKKILYGLLDERKGNDFLKIFKSYERDTILNYLINEVEDEELSIRLNIFFESDNQKLLKNDIFRKDFKKVVNKKVNDYELLYAKVKKEVEELFKNYNFNKEILIVPRAFRNKLAHGHITASLKLYNAEGEDSKGSLTPPKMRKLFLSMSDLLFSIMDKKFLDIYEELKKIK